MKPINPSDKPKVIVLAVLSVGMLGFFTKSILGASSALGNPANAKVVMAPAAAPAGAAPAPTPSVPPGGVATTSPPASTGPSATVNVTGADPRALIPNRIVEFGGPADPFRRVLPDPATLIQPLPPPSNYARPAKTGLTGKVAAGTPAKPGGFDMKPLGPVEPTIRLDGVVADRDRYAMITIGDRTEMYHLGARVGGMFQIIGLSETSVVFRGPHSKFTLEVGDEHRPAEPPAESGPKLMNQSSPQQMADFSGLPLPAPDAKTQAKEH